MQKDSLTEQPEVSPVPEVISAAVATSTVVDFQAELKRAFLAETPRNG